MGFGKEETASMASVSVEKGRRSAAVFRRGEVVAKWCFPSLQRPF
jgi:hypothetical protein